MLILSRKVNEGIILNDVIEVKVLEVAGERVKIGISAPPEVSILRSELWDALGRENMAPASAEGSKSTRPAALPRQKTRARP